MNKTFLSHCWANKDLAKRVARRLTHRGVNIWIDENEIQIGDQLTDRITQEIKSSSHMLVLVTEASAKSLWVHKEIEVALSCDPPPVLLPLVAESNAEISALSDTLSIDITDPLDFEVNLDSVARVLLGDTGPEPPKCNVLRDDLEQMMKDHSSLVSWVQPLLEDGKITIAQIEAASVTKEIQHTTEAALISLFDYWQESEDVRYVISLAAASFYQRYGIGFAALEAQLNAEHHESSHLDTMFSSLSGRFSHARGTQGVIRLLQTCSVPKDQCAASFVRNNFDQLNNNQKNGIVAYFCTPDREPSGFALDLAYDLYARLPENAAVQNVIYYWMVTNELVKNSDGRRFMHYLNEAKKGGLDQFEQIDDWFVQSFRSISRGRSRDAYAAVVPVLHAGSLYDYHRFTDLLEEFNNGLFSAETDWMRSDPDYRDKLVTLAMATNKEDFDSRFREFIQV